MAIALSVALFFSLLLTILAFGYVKYVKPARTFYRLAMISTLSETKIEPKKDSSWLAKALASIGSLARTTPKERTLAKRELASAGFRSDNAPAVFAGTRVLAAIALPALVILFRDHLPAAPILHVIIPAGSAVFGYMLPGIVLDRLARRRRERICLALPDALDMLVVCSEVGCALDQAIQNVSREFQDVHPELSDELSLINMEILAGASRATALRNFAERTDEDETKKLVAIMIQTDRFGTSIADSLRTQSDYMRVRRRQQAEERAGKVGVKLVFPIFFFCMPSLMVVVAGPGILQLLDHFFNALGTP